MVLAWHSSPVDSSLLMQRQTIYSNDVCVSEFSHKKYLRFRID